MANDPNIIAGVASVTVDGDTIRIAGEGTYRPSGSKRDPLGGQDGYHGVSSTPMWGSIKWKGRVSGTTSIATLNEISGATVVLTEATGKMVTGPNMTRTGEQLEVNTEDGTFEIEFVGADVSEILPS